ncbi:hypothetical protein ARMSODRAFT_951978 [Armillaria solidipes]|uniref:Uncharacterized protein n=1 Tax=Armillaria solidipes TaxID=1076256 RepID=A0A2H3BU10_9AGAR|nr:hypothetical protein ARMSODRAFT_951978 [Armillaria solidipes]
MARRKWYAVTAGRAVGLFDNWSVGLAIGDFESLITSPGYLLRRSSLASPSHTT